MKFRTIKDLAEARGFIEGWKTAGAPLIAFLNERLITRAKSGAESAVTKELATLLDELRTVGLSESAPQPPRMKPLSTMGEANSR